MTGTRTFTETLPGFKVIEARNVNDAYYKGMHFIAKHGENRSSRNGGVLRSPVPVATVYAMPWERVLISAQRNANPFFHLIEALWMLDGRNDVKTLDPFVKSFSQFSDDGTTFHGAYGHRWRHWPRSMSVDISHEMDQLGLVISMLKHNHDDRRVVIGMWDPHRDLASASKDVPCNVTVKVMINRGKLDIVVFNRSNDIVWGAYGANAVHMSVLQEYLAKMIGVPMGTYTQISTDYHAYLHQPYFFSEYFPFVDQHIFRGDPYDNKQMAPHPIVQQPHVFDAELKYFMEHVTLDDFTDANVFDRVQDFSNRFFPVVAMPMVLAHRYIRERNYPDALQALISHHEQYLREEPIDWIYASAAWIERKMRLAGEKVKRDQDNARREQLRAELAELGDDS